MTETTTRTNTGNGIRRQSIRLQRNAPASLQINRVPDWNIAIPLLSPLAISPSSVRTAEMKSTEEVKTQAPVRHRQPESENLVFKKWQHPAAPFCYEPAPLVPFFIPV